MATITVGPAYSYQDNGNLEIITVGTGQVTVETSTQLSIVNLFNYTYTFYGSGVTYDTSMATAGGLQYPTAGVVTELRVTKADGSLAFDMSQLNVSAVDLGKAIFGTTSSEQAILKLLLSGDDTFIGGASNDLFHGDYGRNVTAQGGGGRDTLSGGSGVNTLVFTGKASDYTITHPPAVTSYTIQDNRAGAPDGTEIVTNFQFAKFSDGTLPLPTLYTVEFEAHNVLRTDPFTTTYGGLTLSQFVLQAQANSLTAAQIASQLVLQADATTAVATMTYDFFTRYTPTLSGLDYLLSPTGGNANNLNSSYYAQFSTTNRYINFASNLGKVGGEANVSFSAVYGPLSLADATAKAYAAIFGSTPTADKVSHLLNDTVPDGHGGSYARANYFAYYGGDGLTGVGTKAAMVGWLLAQADSAHVGTLETANTAYLLSLATTGLTDHVDLVGMYGGIPYTGP